MEISFPTMPGLEERLLLKPALEGFRGVVELKDGKLVLTNIPVEEPENFKSWVNGLVKRPVNAEVLFF